MTRFAKRNIRFTPGAEVLSQCARDFSCCVFVCALLARNAKLDRIKELKARPEAKAKTKARNAREADRRHAYYRERMNDPGYREWKRQKNAREWIATKHVKGPKNRAWLKANADRMRVRNREYMRRMRREDPNMNVGNRLRSRLWHALKRSASGGKVTKSESTTFLVGCSIRELKRYLEAQFSDGMTWERFLTGEIHIDHKQPCATFDLSDPDQQKLCFHYTNLQPMWASENLRKGARHFGAMMREPEHMGGVA